MKIADSDRVLYRQNPLAEVVCQVRFIRILELETAAPAAFQDEVAAQSYPILSFDTPLDFKIIPSEQNPGVSLNPAQAPRIFHFATEDGSHKVSLSADFVTLTCTKYTEWPDFIGRMLALAKVFSNVYPRARPIRLGLRYKDVIVREGLGLDGARWSELIAPFLLGPIADGALSNDDTFDDSEIGNYMSQTILALDDCGLLLQSGLLTAADGSEKRAFLIDEDFFIADNLPSDCLANDDSLKILLDRLHSNAGKLFRRCIKEKLHAALRPIDNRP